MPEFLDPSKILQQLHLPDNLTAVDFGCGSGGWTIPLASLLENGQVIAVDILDEALSALSSKAKLYNLQNIKKIKGDVEEKIPEIPEESCDLVLITDLLFQAENKEGVFKEARRILKNNGKVLVVEWNPESPFGPKEEKPSKEKIKNIAEQVGFKLEREIPVGDYHFGFLFTK